MSRNKQFRNQIPTSCVLGKVNNHPKIDTCQVFLEFVFRKPVIQALVASTYF